MKQLTQKQQIFADVYDGNGTEACRKAGYKGNDNVLGVQAKNNLKIPKILEIIQKRHLDANAGYIADRETRQSFWSTVMMDADQDMPVRLKASEILGKSCGDFITKLEHRRTFSFADLLQEITLDDDPLVKIDNDTQPSQIGE